MDKTAELKNWIEPSFTPHNPGTINKFGMGSSTAKNVTDNIEGIAVASLIEQYGSPLYVTSEQRLIDNAQQLHQIFNSRYPKVIHGWSYKTNYNSAICKILHKQGSWAEVVSAFEYEKARHLGVPADHIIFNGPHKKRAILQRVVEEGAKLHIDHTDEILMVQEIAKEQGKVMPVTIRLNFETGYTEAWSRFGFNIESGQAIEAARLISLCSHLQLRGLHSHIGTFILDPRAYTAQVNIMCDFMKLVEAETATVIESIDIGGGFASKNALQGVYLPPEQVVPSIHQYADAICGALMEATKDREARGLERPTLIIESGRAVVDDAQSLLSSVVACKRLPNGRRSIVIDAGVNLLFTAFWYNHKLSLTRESHALEEDTIVYGPLCMNIDVVRQSVMLPPMAVGDVVMIASTGAYNNTQWMQFIEYRPNVVLIHPDSNGGKTVSVIREAENLSTMIAQDRLPEHLQAPVQF